MTVGRTDGARLVAGGVLGLVGGLAQWLLGAGWSRLGRAIANAFSDLFGRRPTDLDEASRLIWIFGTNPVNLVLGSSSSSMPPRCEPNVSPWLDACRVFRERFVEGVRRNAKGPQTRAFRFIGETGFEPATARPPANMDGCR
jgi:hypothetical protein